MRVMGVSPGAAEACEGALQALAKGRAGGDGARPGQGTVERLDVLWPERAENLEGSGMQVLVDRHVLRGGLAGGNRREERVVDMLAAADDAIPDGEALEGRETESPGDGVAIGTKVGGVKKELHEGGLSCVLGKVRVTKRPFAEAPEQRPERGEHGAEGRPVTRGERRHGELELFTLPGVHGPPTAWIARSRRIVTWEALRMRAAGKGME
jgi:hypothetical protein